ncbi:hypothetical protein MRX96_017754 [Rhipicephalus microplus]
MRQCRTTAEDVSPQRMPSYSGSSTTNCICAYGLVQERWRVQPHSSFILQLAKWRLLQFGRFEELLSGAQSLESHGREAIHGRSSSAAPGASWWFLAVDLAPVAPLSASDLRR